MKSSAEAASSSASLYGAPHAFVDGFTPALVLGAVTVGLGAAVTVLIPRRRPAAVALQPASGRLTAAPT